MAWCQTGDKPLSEPMLAYRDKKASLGLNEQNIVQHCGMLCFTFIWLYLLYIYISIGVLNSCVTNIFSLDILLELDTIYHHEDYGPQGLECPEYRREISSENLEMQPFFGFKYPQNHRYFVLIKPIHMHIWAFSMIFGNVNGIIWWPKWALYTICNNVFLHIRPTMLYKYTFKRRLFCKALLKLQPRCNPIGGSGIYVVQACALMLWFGIKWHWNKTQWFSWKTWQCSWKQCRLLSRYHHIFLSRF